MKKRTNRKKGGQAGRPAAAPASAGTVPTINFTADPYVFDATTNKYKQVFKWTSSNLTRPAIYLLRQKVGTTWVGPSSSSSASAPAPAPASASASSSLPPTATELSNTTTSGHIEYLLDPATMYYFTMTLANGATPGSRTLYFTTPISVITINDIVTSLRILTNTLNVELGRSATALPTGASSGITSEIKTRITRGINNDIAPLFNSSNLNGIVAKAKIIK